MSRWGMRLDLWRGQDCGISCVVFDIECILSSLYSGARNIITFILKRFSKKIKIVPFK